MNKIKYLGNYKNRNIFIKAVFVLLLFVFSFVVFYNFRPGTQRVQPLPQDSGVKVYFNHNQASSYEDPYRHFTREGDNLEQQIIDAVNQAKSTVDLAVMEFRLPKVAEALNLAQKRGVKVRVMIDNRYNKTLADYTPTTIAHMNRHDKLALEELKRYPADALDLLLKNGIDIKDDTSGKTTKGSGLMHHKFVVIDGKTTIISSGNLTTSDLHGDFGNFQTRGNPNNMVVIPDNVQLATTFTDEFNYMWQGLFKSHKPKRNLAIITTGTGGTIAVNFSPAKRNEDIAMTSNGAIAAYIQQAKKSVHMALFVYSDQNISDTLGDVHEQGVEDVKVLVDPDFLGKPYSKAYDAMGVCPRLDKKNHHIKVKPWKHPITTVGYPVAPSGDRGVHSKMAILDEFLVITGSHNWTNSGNYSNDETLIFIQNPTVAAHYEREFSRLYRTAKVGLKTLPHTHKCGDILLKTTPSSTEPTESDDSSVDN